MDFSKNITNHIDKGDLSLKPGWIRLSIHPTMKNIEIEYIMSAIKGLAENHQEWSKEYTYDSKTNEFKYFKKIDSLQTNKERVNSWFSN